LKPALEKALESSETFVFLHARFVNLPLPLIPLLHKSSHDDMAWAQSSEVRLFVILCWRGEGRERKK
jgi:hypothetical protein